MTIFNELGDIGSSLSFWREVPGSPEEIMRLGRMVDGSLFTTVQGDTLTAAMRVREMLLAAESHAGMEVQVQCGPEEVLTVRGGKITVAPALFATAPEFWGAVTAV